MYFGNNEHLKARHRYKGVKCSQLFNLRNWIDENIETNHVWLSFFGFSFWDTTILMQQFGEHEVTSGYAELLRYTLVFCQSFILIRRPEPGFRFRDMDMEFCELQCLSSTFKMHVWGFD